MFIITDSIFQLSEEVKETITFLGQPHLTPEGILQMYTKERGNLEISICDLIESLDALGNRQVSGSAHIYWAVCVLC